MIIDYMTFPLLIADQAHRTLVRAEAADGASFVLISLWKNTWHLETCTIAQIDGKTIIAFNYIITSYS